MLGGFNLYLYGVGDNPDQNSLFTLAGANGGASGFSPESNRLVMANSYVLLAGNADGSGNASFTFQAADNDGGG